MNKPLQRFDFGTLRDFRGPIQFTPEMPRVAEEAPPPPPPAPTFSEDQLQQARMDAKKLGYNEGFAAGMAQAAAEADSQQQAANAALQTIAAQVAALTGGYMDILKQQSLDVSELALLIARKVAGEALSARAVDSIAAMVGRCLPSIYQRPRLVVELHPDTLPLAEARLNALLREQGYEGELQFRPNPALAVSDTKLDWGNGMAERSTDALWKSIENMIERTPIALEIPTPTAEPTGE